MTDALSPASSGRIFGAVRIAVGVMWLTNVAWKTPPDFGKVSGGGLYGYTYDAVSHPVFAPFTFFVKHLVLPHFTLFGWSVLIVESLLAAFLLLGIATRFWALLGMVQSAAIGLSAGLAPGEWPWSYYLMFMAHACLFAAAAGRTWGLDGLIRSVAQKRTGRVARLALVAS